MPYDSAGSRFLLLGKGLSVVFVAHFVAPIR